MMNHTADHKAFVASFIYCSDKYPMTVEEARYTMEQWAEEDSVEVPEGFTPEIFADIWNRFLTAETT